MDSTQITGDSIYLFTQNKEIKRIDVFGNAFVINMQTNTIFNQIKGKFLQAFIENKKIEYIDVDGNAESIYFAKDKDAPLDYAQDLMDRGKSAIICSHNPILPKLLKKLIGKKNFKQLDQKLEPGEAWVLHHRDGEIIAIDWAEAPKA
jgi:hypothetical protein